MKKSEGNEFITIHLPIENSGLITLDSDSSLSTGKLSGSIAFEQAMDNEDL